MGVSFRKILVLATALTLSACAAAPALKPAPIQPDPSKAPLAVIGLFECGKMKGILVVTKSGEVVAVEDDNPADLAAIMKGLPDGSAGVINLTDECIPSQKT